MSEKLSRETVREALEGLDLAAAASSEAEAYWLVPEIFEIVLDAAQAWVDLEDAKDRPDVEVEVPANPKRHRLSVEGDTQ